MPVVPARTAPAHELPGTRFTSLATPSRGSSETAIWEILVAAGTAETPVHRVTREELFVVLSGCAAVVLDGVAEVATDGDTIIVPPDTDFSLANAGDNDLRMVCCLPVGGQVSVDGEGTFTPPWAQ